MPQPPALRVEGGSPVLPDRDVDATVDARHHDRLTAARVAVIVRHRYSSIASRREHGMAEPVDAFEAIVNNDYDQVLTCLEPPPTVAAPRPSVEAS